MTQTYQSYCRRASAAASRERTGGHTSRQSSVIRTARSCARLTRQESWCVGSTQAGTGTGAARAKERARAEERAKARARVKARAREEKAKAEVEAVAADSFACRATRQ